MNEAAQLATRPAVLVLLVLLSSGCLAESHVPDSDGPIQLEDFCDAFVAALCEPLAGCGCSETAVSTCERDRAVLCIGFPSPALASAVESGRVRYDAERGRALVSRMHERGLACEDFVAALDWRVSDLLSLGGVFSGQLAPGEACTSLGFELISECDTGTCAPIEGEMTCLGAVDAGASCDRLHYCADLAGPLTSERGIERLTLRCVEDVHHGGGGSRCAGWADAGEPCDADGACWTSRCIEGTCASLNDGDACFSSRECGSAHCADGFCAPGGRAAGEPCEASSACLSHSCVAGRCEPTGCGTF
ncbi:MAG: hypothetical protein AB8I08_07300 [Sandaracinaceae bacterium]